MPSTQDTRPPINVTTSVLFLLTFVAALVLVPWYGIAHGYKAASWILCIAFIAANEMAITAGYHRLWAHKSYDAHWSVQFVYLVFGTMALQNTVLAWASGHRRHHLHVDDWDQDPYSIRRGFWFAHIGWMLRHYRAGEDDFSNVPDLRRDPMLQFQQRHYVPLVLLTNIGLPVVAGLLIGDVIGTFLLAGLFRLVWSHHATWCINSLAHMWGARPYTDTNTARDNPVLAVLTFGEGYHNFHHLFAHDYRNGVRWWQWDPTKWLIAGLSAMGLTRKLRRTPAFQVQRALLAMQFRRTQERLARLPAANASHIELARQRVAHEYESFLAAVADWARVKEQWLEQTRQAVIEQWQQARFHERLSEIERRLRMQRRRMRLLHAQLAA